MTRSNAVLSPVHKDHFDCHDQESVEAQQQADLHFAEAEHVAVVEGHGRNQLKEDQGEEQDQYRKSHCSAVAVGRRSRAMDFTGSSRAALAKEGNKKKSCPCRACRIGPE